MSYAASSPAPDPPPPVVAPDAQPPEPVVVTPPRPREAPAVQASGPRSVAPAPVVTTARAQVVDKTKPSRRAVRRAVVKKPTPAPPPNWVVTTRHQVPRDVWAAPRATAAVSVPAVEVLQRRRFALAGVALALVAVGGGVILGVGGRTLRETTS